jgi:hypothetical protein
MTGAAAARSVIAIVDVGRDISEGGAFLARGAHGYDAIVWGRVLIILTGSPREGEDCWSMVLRLFLENDHLNFVRVLQYPFPCDHLCRMTTTRKVR